MADAVRPALFFALPDGSELGLRVSRFDERQRRLRLRLPKAANCWDYAPLIDVTRREPGFGIHRFTGQSAAQWLAELKDRQFPEHARAMHWYESVVDSVLATLARRPRVPDNHYCIELAAPPLHSSLPRVISKLGLRRASAGQWQATLRALTGKGIKAEELDASGVLTRLGQLTDGAAPTVAEVIRMVDLRHITPKFASESRFGFVTTAGWYTGCKRIPAREYRRRGLMGAGRDALHVIRFRHQSLGWSVVRTRYRDLVTERTDWWSVLDERGRFIQQPVYGFECPEDAMAFAELRMSREFAPWGTDQALSKWERFSLQGGDGYQEILLQLDDWPGNYQPRHYRTRNVLVHVRTSIRLTQDGRRVLFLDEIQSDWHADIRAEAKPGSGRRQSMSSGGPPPDAPFRKEWPLLSMKLMLWWAQRLGVDGLAWSTAELQLARWRGHGPPETLYRSVVPEAALAISKTLGIENAHTLLSIRADTRCVVLGKNGWVVGNRQGVPITKPFRTRVQAESFADQTGEFVVIEVPVLWLHGLPTIRSIPLYGVDDKNAWLDATQTASAAPSAPQSATSRRQRNAADAITSR